MIDSELKQGVFNFAALNFNIYPLQKKKQKNLKLDLLLKKYFKYFLIICLIRYIKLLIIKIIKYWFPNYLAVFSFSKLAVDELFKLFFINFPVKIPQKQRLAFVDIRWVIFVSHNFFLPRFFLFIVFFFFIRFSSTWIFIS